MPEQMLKFQKACKKECRLAQNMFPTKRYDQTSIWKVEEVWVWEHELSLQSERESSLNPQRSRYSDSASCVSLEIVGDRRKEISCFFSARWVPPTLLQLVPVLCARDVSEEWKASVVESISQGKESGRQNLLVRPCVLGTVSICVFIGISVAFLPMTLVPVGDDSAFLQVGDVCYSTKRWKNKTVPSYDI